MQRPFTSQEDDHFKGRINLQIAREWFQNVSHEQIYTVYVHWYINIYHPALCLSSPLPSAARSGTNANAYSMATRTAPRNKQRVTSKHIVRGPIANNALTEGKTHSYSLLRTHPVDQDETPYPIDVGGEPAPVNYSAHPPHLPRFGRLSKPRHSTTAGPVTQECSAATSANRLDGGWK